MPTNVGYFRMTNYDSKP